MRAITRLPNRPLREKDVAALDDQLRIAPYGGIPEGGEVLIYAVKIATENEAHALGFDDAREQWAHLASVDAADLAAADSRLDVVIDEWVQETYGDEFDVLKPVEGSDNL